MVQSDYAQTRGNVALIRKPPCQTREVEGAPLDAVSTNAEQHIGAKRARAAIVAIFFVVATVWGAMFANHLHDVQMKRAAISQQLRQLQSQSRAIMATGQSANSLFRQIIAKDADARNAGTKRHDNAASDSPDVHYMYAQAQREYADVDAMQSVLGRLYDKSEILGDEYEAALGADSASTFRTHLRTANEAWEDSLSNWWRAISDIRDSLRAEAEGASPNFDDSSDTHFYEASSESQSRASRYWVDAANDLKQLQTRLVQRQGSLKNALAAM